MARTKKTGIGEAIARGMFKIAPGGTVNVNGTQYRADGSPVPSREDAAKLKRRAANKRAKASRKGNRRG